MLDLNPVKARPRGVIYPFVYEAEECFHNWEMLEPFVEASCRFSFDMLRPEVVKQMLTESKAVCMGIARDEYPLAILVIEVVQYSNYRAARIIVAAGRELKEAMKFLPILEEWAHTLGATEIEAWCRPAMTRLVKRFGFKPRLTMLTLNIKRTLQ